jgi:hypothetical protein
MATAHSVAELLNAAQDSRSEAALARCAGQLWKLILQDPEKHYEQLLQCVDLLLSVSQVGSLLQALVASTCTVAALPTAGPVSNTVHCHR